ncbi:MAG: hypothetical protein IKJ68_09520 [Clostridia bacterium]|nr:hypothetical protein [Clostridia bacterium]
MKKDSMVQKSRDSATQIQAQEITIINGIDEKRVREVCSEMAVDAIKQCTQEATATALARIENFTTALIPRMEKIEEDFRSFTDPSFQFELQKAQKVAACTERTDDYDLLSELLVHRAENKTNRKTISSISKAIEIVDQIDDDALCGLTIIYTITQLIPTSGHIMSGLRTIDDIWKALCYVELPSGFDWLEHLEILGAVRISSVNTFNKLKEIYYKNFDGYTCVGIKEGSEAYKTAEDIFKQANVTPYPLENHELNNGYLRIPVVNKKDISRMAYFKEIGDEKYTVAILEPTEIEALEKVWGLYESDAKKKQEVKTAFWNLWNQFDTLQKVTEWWDAIPRSFEITPIGKVIAHANSQKYCSQIPDIKL